MSQEEIVNTEYFSLDDRNFTPVEEPVDLPVEEPVENNVDFQVEHQVEQTKENINISEIIECEDSPMFYDDEECYDYIEIDDNTNTNTNKEKQKKIIKRKKNIIPLNKNIDSFFSNTFEKIINNIIPEPAAKPALVPEEAVTVPDEAVTVPEETVTVPEETEPAPIKTPYIVFIVPYRDRKQQYNFFSKHMKEIMVDYPKGYYEIFYIHQCDNREFNRGAMKNIGFLFVKQKYPNHYKDITLVFNDIDIMPFTKNFLNYETTHNIVKHFYGFHYTLGGIVSIKGNDFEKINGFPNFWAWGFEDNLIQKRVILNNINIDRSQFYNIMDKNILLLHDGLSRLVNRKEFDRYIGYTNEGINSITNLNYQLDDSTNFVNVHNFVTEFKPSSNSNFLHDLRNGPKPFGDIVKPNTKQISNTRPRKIMSMVF